MTLDDIEEGAGVFVDANVFVYHFVGASSECTALLRRCETGEVQASTSALVLAKVCQRLMMIEPWNGGSSPPATSRASSPWATPESPVRARWILSRIVLVHRGPLSAPTS
jgi:predicted nucleic acid-binding protein